MGAQAVRPAARGVAVRHHLIYGDRDWMRHEHASFALENTVPPEFRVASAVRVLKGAAHNVQVDAWQEVNVILGELARKHTV